jgi:hypothetical protein
MSPKRSRGIVVAFDDNVGAGRRLALQLSFCFEVSPLRGGLVCSAPD